MNRITVSAEDLKKMGGLIALPIEPEAAEEARALTEAWLNEGIAFTEMMSSPEFTDLAPAAMIAFDR